MITVEEKQTLESEICDLEQQISILQEELLNKKRILWWAKRPHIAEFNNSDWYLEGDDQGGSFPVFCPYDVVLNPEWLSVAGNQALIDQQLAYIAECNSDDYDSDQLHDFLICGLSTEIYCEFCDDPYPDFQNAPDIVRNPNYV